MSRRLHQPLAVRLDDEKSERVRQSHHRALSELQGLPASGMRVVGGVELPDGVRVYVRHGLGRAPLWVGISAVRGSSLTSGRIRDRTAQLSEDASQVVVLQAAGWTNTVTVDLLVL